MSERVLDRFTGTVDKIEGDMAHIHATASRGLEFTASYPVAELKAASIGEGDDFRGELLLIDGNTCLRFTLLPRRKLTDAEIEEIWHKAQELSDGL